MTLHETTELIKKGGIGSAIGIVVIIIIVIFVRVGITIWQNMHPSKVDPATKLLGNLPPIQFPPNQANGNFSYTIQTATGALPDVGYDFQNPDNPNFVPPRLSVFRLIQPAGDLLALDNAKEKMKNLGFTTALDEVVPENKLKDSVYEWDEPKDLNRIMTFQIYSHDFKMTSDYLQKNYIFTRQQFIPDPTNAIKTVQDFLNTASLTPSDLDLTKTTTPDNPLHYVTYPKLYKVVQGADGGGSLSEASSQAEAHVVRVDLYQKDIEYDLSTGQALELHPVIHRKIPVIYPQPPFSTMNFMVSAGPIEAMVTEAHFIHHAIDLTSTDATKATYNLKTPDQAFTELKNGQAYLAAYYGSDSNIFIKKVYIAYYLSDLDPSVQPYLMPVYVFEGNNGFFAYVSALTDDQIQQ